MHKIHVTQTSPREARPLVTVLQSLALPEGRALLVCTLQRVKAQPQYICNPLASLYSVHYYFKLQRHRPGPPSNCHTFCNQTIPPCPLLPNVTHCNRLPYLSNSCLPMFPSRLLFPRPGAPLSLRQLIIFHTTQGRNNTQKKNKIPNIPHTSDSQWR